MIEEKSMSEQRKIIHDDNNGLDYVLVGDYYIPMLALPEENRPSRVPEKGTGFTNENDKRD